MVIWRAGSRGACRAPACLALLFAAIVLLPASGAFAATGHPFVSSLSEAPAGVHLGEPGAVAVDHATGQVFVGDLGSGRIDVFSSSGTFETSFGEELEPVALAVDESNGDVYVVEPFEHAVFVYEPDGKGGYRLLSEWFGAGTPGKAFGEISGVAVDNSSSASDPSKGEVYVVESEGVGTEGGAVDVFQPVPNPEGVEEDEGEEGKFLKRLSGPRLEEPNAVTVASTTGRVLVADSVKGQIYAYSNTGEFEEKLAGKGSPNGSFAGNEGEEGNVAGIAVDEASDIYVAESEHHAVSQYSATGEWLGWITTTPSAALAEPRGVALSAAGSVYVADTATALVDLFGPGVVVPDVTTGKAAKLTRTTVLLKGTIAGEAATYHFEWGTTPAYGQSTPATHAGSSEEAVAVALDELHAGTTYYYRIVGEDEHGANYGVGREFTTPTAVEGLSTGPVASLTPSSATLTGSLTPGGFDAHYYFEWGTSLNYGETTPQPPGVDAGSGAGAVAAEVAISGLTPNTTYHYRLVGNNSFGPTVGSDQKFTTSGPPRITTEAPNEIGHEHATLHASVNPDELATEYHFEYGETTVYGSEVPAGGASIGSGSEPVAVAATLGGLKLGVTYHFRVVAKNATGPATVGPDQRFTTIPPAPIDATYATGVSSTEATLTTEINPLGHDTSYYFQYGTEACKANPGACVDVPEPPGADIGAGETDVVETLPLTHLTPQTTYHYRVLATNSLGTTEGQERTLTTRSAESPVALADNRAWEMVSPIDKHGAPIEALTREGGVILAAEDGDSITYVADGSIVEQPQGNRSPEQQQDIATQDARRLVHPGRSDPQQLGHRNLGERAAGVSGLLS